MIFRWEDLSKNYASQGASVRESLIRMLTSLQDASEWTVAVVFDGTGVKPSEESQPHGIKVFYSKSGQTADSLIERLAAKYASLCELTVATDDNLERITVETLGATAISSSQLRSEIQAAEESVRTTIRRLNIRH